MGGDYTLHIEGVSVTTAAPGSMTTSSLSAGGHDDFHFTLTENKGLAIYTEGTTDVTARLYNGVGTLLATNEDSGNFRIDRPFFPGTYFIRVSGNDMSTSGAYTLHVEGSSVTTATVNPMTAPSYTLAAGANDYFKLTLAAAQRLAVYTGGSTDTTGTLYDDSGNFLAMEAGGGEGNNFRIERLLVAGTYFIRVSGNTATVSGGYTLNVEKAGSVSTAEVDPSTTTSTIDPAGDSDYFQFTLASAQGVVIYTTGSTNITGSLYNAHGALLTTDENSGDGDNFRIERMLDMGTYFIEVKGDTSSITGSYTLRVTPFDTITTTLTLPSMAGEMKTSDQTPTLATGTDYFRFQVGTVRALSIFYSGSPPGGATLRITIYDANANILVNRNDARNDGSEFRASLVGFTPGTYFLAVHADNYNTSYTINIKWEDI